MNYEEKFWLLFSKKLSGEASNDELKELEKIINEHPEWQYAIQNLTDLWKQKPEIDSSNEEDAYMLHLNRMSDKNVAFDQTHDSTIFMRNVKMKWFIVAASAALLIISGFLIFNKSNSVSENKSAFSEINEITTRLGSKSKVQLPDGTTVLLNAGSRLTYNKDFGKELREVSLIGEGYFDVKRNTDIPFIIHTANIDIKVLGTVFNVKAYPEASKTETSLIHGSIEVTIKNRPNDKIILSPSEKLVVENNMIQQKDASSDNILPEPIVTQPLIAINKLKYNHTDSSIAEIQWIDNKLVFRDESFIELALDMGRWYNATISITDPVLAGMRLTGIFENETIEQALEALKVSTSFNYEKKGNIIIIHK